MSCEKEQKLLVMFIVLNRLNKKSVMHKESLKEIQTTKEANLIKIVKKTPPKFQQTNMYSSPILFSVSY